MRLSGWFVGLLIAGCCLAPVEAQPGGLLMARVSQWESQSLPLKMVRNDKIASLLEITPQQLENVDEQVRQTHERIDGIFREHLKDHDEQELRTISNACSGEIRKFPSLLFAQLEEAQARRLIQICSRYMVQQKYGGLGGFLLSTDADRLGLSEDQLQAVRDKGNAGEPQILAVLSAEQQQTLGNMLGEPLDFAEYGIEFRRGSPPGNR